MSKKHIFVAGLIAVVLATAVVAVGLSDNASPDESSSLNEDETETEGITAGTQTDWDGTTLTITVTSDGDATEVEARGDVTQTRSVDSRAGNSIELSCSDLSASSGTVDVVGTDGSKVTVLESVEYSGC